MASWGSYELWGRSCSDDLKQYTIYTCAYSMVVYQWIIVGLLTIAALALSIMSCMSSGEPTKIPVPVLDNKLVYNKDDEEKDFDQV